MNVYVDSTIGRIRIPVSDNDLCINLRQSLERKIGYALCQFTLRFGCHVLVDRNTLKSYGICDNSILELYPKLLGGM
jgi:hypothetical protein